MRNYTLKAIALAGVCLAPLAAMAQDDTGLGLSGPVTAAQPMPGEDKPVDVYDNSVEAGLKWQSATSGYFGQFNGSYEGGLHAIGGFSLRSRDDWKSNGTSYFELEGNDLDFTNRTYGPESSVDLRLGNQGKWGVTAGYDAITFTQSTEFSSIYNTNGTFNNGVTGFAFNKTTNYQYLLNDSNQYLMQTRRDIGSFGGKYMVDEWVFTGDYQHIHKAGLMEQSAEAGGAKVAFPEDIDYDFDRATVQAAYYTKPLQAQVGYVFSNFLDNNEWSRLENLGQNTSTNVWAQYQQAPSNSAHTVYGNFAYNLTPTTRVNATLKDSIELQDANFGGDLNTPSNASDWLSNPNSIDGKVNTIFGNLLLTSRPMPKLNVKASYTFDIRDDMTDNRNAMSIYSNSGNSGSEGATAINCTLTAPCLAGMPLDWTKQNIKLSAGYRVLDNTTVSAGYNFSDVQRNNTLVDHSQENEVWAGARTNFGNDLNGSVKYSHSVRAATLNQAAESGFTFNAAPWYQQSRTQDALTVRTDYQPVDQMQLGLNAKGAYNHYPNQYTGTETLLANGFAAGMKSDYDFTVGPDMSWEPAKGISVHAFYEFERAYHDAEEAYAAANADPISEQTTEDTHTAGVGGDWKVNDDLKLGTDYVFMTGATNIDVFSSATSGSCTNTVLVACPLPNVNTTMNTFKLHGEYQIMPGVSLWAGYGLDILKSSDFLLGTPGYSGSESATFLDTDSAPWYVIHTVATKIKFKW